MPITPTFERLSSEPAASQPALRSARTWALSSDSLDPRKASIRPFRRNSPSRKWPANETFGFPRRADETQSVKHDGGVLAVCVANTHVEAYRCGTDDLMRKMSGRSCRSSHARGNRHCCGAHPDRGSNRHDGASLSTGCRCRNGGSLVLFGAAYSGDC